MQKIKILAFCFILQVRMSVNLRYYRMQPHPNPSPKERELEGWCKIILYPLLDFRLNRLVDEERTNEHMED